MTIGVVNPGEMGAAVAGVLTAEGRRVVWASEGRSESTRKRADDASVEDVGDLKSLAERAEVILSICPPHAAEAVATAISGVGFEGIYIDANAVSPDTATRVRTIVETSGARFVDGGIIGGPPRPGGYTRLYLSGSQAGGIAALFEGTHVTAAVLEGPTSPSALKMCFAAYTKGTAALLTAIRALAEYEGVADALSSEWQDSQPGLTERSESAPRGIARKAWRFSGEMEEIADSMEAAGLPDGFHRAAAELYRRLDHFKDRVEPPTLADVLAATRQEVRPRPGKTDSPD